MTSLLKLIRRQIETTGPISVSDYMAQCLCHPQHGYYMTHDPFGVKGDFITAPEISQVFGELLGLWAAITWQQMGAPSSLNLVELGPGRGTLMKDALRATQSVPGFHAALHVHLLEVSPILRQLQEDTLKDIGVEFSWHQDFADVPVGPAIYLANEFFDALPVRQFEKREQGWAERFVDLDPDADGLRLVLQTDQAAQFLLPPSLKGTEEIGSLFETSSSAHTIANDLGQRIKDQGGAVLVIDYGHERSGFGETLQALKQHVFDPVLSHPGQADLTAHVDFETLSRSFTEAGAKVWGPVLQGSFLECLGISQRMEVLLKHAAPDQRDQLIEAHKRLCSPHEMGSLFKVICATTSEYEAPAGFEV